MVPMLPLMEQLTVGIISSRQEMRPSPFPPFSFFKRAATPRRLPDAFRHSRLRKTGSQPLAPLRAIVELRPFGQIQALLAITAMLRRLRETTQRGLEWKARSSPGNPTDLEEKSYVRV